MTKVAVVPYARKTGVREMTAKLIDFLDKHGVEIALPEIEAVELGFPRHSAADGDLFRGAEFAVALGGDGTTLRALRLMGGDTVPLLGINLGEMGFLMWVKPERMEPALERCLAGDYRIEERHMLAVKIMSTDGTVIERLALNDVLVGREEFSRLIKLDIHINGNLFCRYSADGVLVATPTGSTAYSFSAGGPFISPKAPVYVMVPVCPHSLNNKSLVFCDEERLTIRPVPAEPMGRAGVSIDGVPLHDLGAIDSIDVGLAGQKFKFIGLNGPDFYQSLSDKLKRWLGLA